MARQGNYVTVPGGNANWTEGIASTLAMLSKRYGDRASDEREAQRLEAAQEESARRFDLQEARANRAEQLELDKVKKAEAANNALWDIQRKGVNYTLEDHPDHLKRAYTQLTDNVTNELNTATEFLTSDGYDVQKATAAYRESLAPSGNTSKEIDRLVAQREQDLISLKDQITFEAETPEEKQKLIDDFVTSQYKSRLDEINKKIRTGEALTSEERVSKVLSTIDPSIRGSLSVADAKSVIAPIVGGISREVLLANEDARVKQINEEKLQDIELFDKYVQRSNAGYTRRAKDYDSTESYKQAVKLMGDIDIGYFDTNDANEGFEFLKQNGIDPEIAALAVKSGISQGFFDDSFPNITDPDFLKVVEEAKNLQAQANNGASGKRVIPTLKAYQLDREKPRSFKELQRSLTSFTAAPDRIVLDPAYDQLIPDRNTKYAYEGNITNKQNTAGTPVGRELPPAVVEQQLGDALKNDPAALQLLSDVGPILDTNLSGRPKGTGREEASLNLLKVQRAVRRADDRLFDALWARARGKNTPEVRSIRQLEARAESYKTYLNKLKQDFTETYGYTPHQPTRFTR